MEPELRHWEPALRGVRVGPTGQGLSSLQHLLDVSHHDALDVLQLRVDAAQIPPGSTVDVGLLGFLDVGVWWGGQRHTRVQQTGRHQKPRGAPGLGFSPNSMKEYGRDTVGTFFPCCSWNSACRSSK